MLHRILSNCPQWLAPAVLALGLAACGGGGGSMSGPTGGPQGCTTSTCGNAMLTLTDAPGDFASYKVGVSSLKLTKADGTVVETLPVSTTVDFTQLINVTELVTTAAIPQGEYVAATMTLDYSSASIFVYTDSNDTMTTQVAQVQDSQATPTVLWSSNSMTTTSPKITVTVQFDSAHHFFVSPGKLSRLALDFNVAQSNTVAQTSQGWVVTVLPTLVASAVPTDTKSIRVRGPLVSVDTTNDSYVVNIAPFEDKDAGAGQATVQTTSATTFEVDGKSLNQADGISALNADGAGTLTVAFGTLSTTDHTFTATRVLAGSSVQSAKLDRLQGVVTSRPACPSTAPTGAVCLVVHSGRIAHHEDGDDQFSAKDVALTIDGSTTITSAAGQPSGAAPLSWPSVGSKITAFGTRGMDSQSNPTFDASGITGRLRVEVTSLWGTAGASGIGTGQVTLSLQAIEGLPVTAFTFAGTGATTAQDSNPQNYLVTTGALPLPTLSATATSALRFYGLVQPFGSAPPDFNALTLVNFSDTAATLMAGFGSGSTMALAVTTAGDLTLNVSDPALGWMHYIKIGPQLIDLTKLASNVTIHPDPASSGPFVIRSEGTDWHDTITEYNSGADFVTALGAKLSGGAGVQQVFAMGHYDSTSNTLTAEQIAVGTN